MAQGRLQNLAGRRFGTLLAQYRAGRIRRNAAWMCKCDCGVERRFSSADLLLGRRRFCGSAIHRSEYKRPPRGLTTQFSSEWRSWAKMLERCNNPRNQRYKNYGGRGIKVCARWKEFKNFLEDMGQKPDLTYSIDRKDVNGNYEPGNCRWATRAEQMRNTTRTVYVEYEGKRMLLHDLTNSLGLKRGIVYGRLKSGWSLRDALSIPVRTHIAGIKKVRKTRIRSEMIGKQFGWLVVIEQAGTSFDAQGRRKTTLWKCRCTCGAVVVKRGDHLRDGKVKACAKNGHRFRPKSGDAKALQK